MDHSLLGTWLSIGLGWTFHDHDCTLVAQISRKSSVKLQSKLFLILQSVRGSRGVKEEGQ